MRKYYIFIIRTEFYKIYKNNSLVLYKTLENLYKLNNNNFGYGFSIYNQLCLTFNTEVLNNYFLRKFANYKHNKHYIQKEQTILEINKSCIVVLTKYNVPKSLKYLLYYNKYLFVCDFDNKDYFWLQNQYDLNIN
ncbi:MAG: sporulation inhibitor of replication protein SirA [Firmicutes bacterium]|nr:sporulation inhibitor of replication protein SirA [Bacillota bacterium]